MPPQASTPDADNILDGGNKKCQPDTIPCDLSDESLSALPSTMVGTAARGQLRRLIQRRP